MANLSAKELLVRMEQQQETIKSLLERAQAPLAAAAADPEAGVEIGSIAVRLPTFP